MKKTTLLFAGAAALTLFSSCKDDTQFEGFTRAENGLHYKFFNHDESGAKPQLGDFVSLRYTFNVQRNDSVIMNSKDNSRDGSGFVDINLQKSTFVGSLEDGLFMMAKGDSAAFIVPADSFFLKTMQMNQLPPFIKSGDHIKAVIKLGNIKGKQEVEAQRQKEMAEREAMMKEKQALELPALEKYIADNKINVKPTASGLYYIETKKGSGANPKPTDFVKVHYTGTLLDGKVFDSSVERGEPVEFPLNGVIAGWTEGLQLMKKGGKAKLIIPSSLGYGGQEAGPIPMFSSLVFEVELIDIKEAPKQEGNPNQMPGAQPH